MRVLLTIVAICCLSDSSTASVEIEFDVVAAQTHCKTNWTKRGNLDVDMFKYCMTSQIDGFNKTNELYRIYKDVEIIDDILRHSLSKWASRRGKEYQFDMVAYELEKEVESYLDIIHDVQNKKVDNNKLSECKSKWISIALPQWSMVKYCISN